MVLKLLRKWLTCIFSCNPSNSFTGDQSNRMSSFSRSSEHNTTRLM
uniref:Uncharacterized protein n=2 Tax=Anguilla anguilla TaxID=7936 RepID=A0A0E9PYP4_ANGAN